LVDQNLQGRNEISKLIYANQNKEFVQEARRNLFGNPSNSEKRNNEPTEEDSKFDPDFFNHTDYSDAQRNQYYESLKVDMNALD
jgi:hypothetical protein